jgi:hypothetical protein
VRKARETRTEIEAAVAAGERSIEQATRDLTAARVAYTEAEGAYIDSGKKAALEAKRDAGDALERAEALHRRATERLDVARAALAALGREEKTRELEELRAALASFSGTVEQHGAEFADLDRAVENRVMALAVEVRDAIAKHDRAVAIERELRLPDNLEPRPDLANVSLQVRRILSAARQREGRDALAPHWLQDAPDARDWRLRDLSAGDLTDLDRTRERNMQIERDRVAAATFAAGQRSGPPQPKPETPEPKANSERVDAVLAAGLE